MIIQVFKLFFGKIIGLDRIPKEKRNKFLKDAAIPLLKEAAVSAAKSKGKEVTVQFKRKL